VPGRAAREEPHKESGPPRKKRNYTHKHTLVGPEKSGTEPASKTAEMRGAKQILFKRIGKAD